jgi:hypothetical protein
VATLGTALSPSQAPQTHGSVTVNPSTTMQLNSLEVGKKRAAESDMVQMVFSLFYHFSP